MMIFYWMSSIKKFMLTVYKLKSNFDTEKYLNSTLIFRTSSSYTFTIDQMQDGLQNRARNIGCKITQNTCWNSNRVS